MRPRCPSLSNVVLVQKGACESALVNIMRLPVPSARQWDRLLSADLLYVSNLQDIVPSLSDTNLTESTDLTSLGMSPCYRVGLQVFVWLSLVGIGYA